MQFVPLVRLLTAAGAASALAVSAGASVVASDGFSVPPYSLASLAGQTVFGSGFTGTWATVPGLAGDLSVNASGVVGRPAGPLTSTAGDYALLASPLPVNSGQFYFGCKMTNLGNGNLSSTRLDLNFNAIGLADGWRVHLGAEGSAVNFNLQLETNLSSGQFQVTAQTSIPSTGSHYLVGVLDVQNRQVAIFVDPDSASFYNTNGANNASAVAAWSPAAGLTLSSYSFIENTVNGNVNFGQVVLATDPLSAGIGLVPNLCAITGDGTASVADVQQIIDEVLGMDPPSNDLNGDEVVNVADVQVDIQAVLYQVCLAGTQTQAMVQPQSRPRVLAAAGVSRASLAAPELPASFTDLGTLGGESATANGLNDLGQVVGASGTGQDGVAKSACPRCAVSHAFLWVAGQMTDLDRGSTEDSAAYSINFAGQIVGAYSAGRDSAGFLYSGGAIAVLSQVSRGTVSAINNSGRIIGGLEPEGADSRQAFAWHAGTVMTLGTLGGTGSQARAINDSGQIAGFAYLEGNAAMHAFLYSGAGLADLGTLGGGNSAAFGMNSAGEVVGSSQIAGSSQRHAFLYNGGAMTDLGTLGGSESQADGISDRGVIVGWSGTASGQRHAFVWYAGRMVDLNSLVDIGTGIWLAEATACNNAGQIVANGSNGRAYLIVLPPQFR